MTDCDGTQGRNLAAKDKSGTSDPVSLFGLPEGVHQRIGADAIYIVPGPHTW
jgi:hypothetical protein